MRVIGGDFKGRRLRTAAGLDVRPTSDRLRETLFNILRPYVRDSRFLDICAGSGAVGIEAISRGASHTVFIDNSRRACSAITENLRALGIVANAEVINRDALTALRGLDAASREVDLIFFDPPYASNIYEPVMRQLAASQLLTDEAIVVVEHRTKIPPEPNYGRLHLTRNVKQGESALSFYTLQEKA